MNIPIKNISEISTPPVGYGYIFVDAADNKLKVKKHNTIVEYTNTLDDIQLLDLSNYTAFEVYAHDTDIPSGKLTTPHLNYIGKEGDSLSTLVPASMIETFAIRSESKQEEQDVIVDWGDSTFIELKNVVPNVLVGGEYRYTISHTYEKTGTYKIKILGKKYFGIMTSNDANTTLLSRIFDPDLPLASWIWNVSSIAKRAPRLLHVNFYSHNVAIQAINWSHSFTLCDNLLDVFGFTKYNNNYTVCNSIFANDRALISTDFRLPSNPRTIDACTNAFTKCSSLTADINELLPINGFKPGSTIDLTQTFRACYNLTGIISSKLLWNNKNINWINIDKAFDVCKSPFIDQIPASWGGTASDSIIETDFITIQRPVFDDTLFPKVILSKDIDFTDTIEFDPLNTSTDLNYFKVFTSDYWTDIPEDGLGIPFEGMEVIVNVSKGRQVFGETFYVKYCWVTADGSESNFKSFIYPSVTNSSASSGTGDSNSVDLSGIENQLATIQSALNTTDTNVNYQFTVSDSSTTLITFTKEQLGVSTKFEFDIIDSNGYNITADSRLSRRWNDDVFELSMFGGWTAGTYTLKSVQGVQGGPWTMTYITNTEDTDPVINLQGGVRYTFNSPLNSLTLTNVANSHFESEIVFTAGDGIYVDVPANVEFLGTFNVESGNKYLMNIRDGIIALGILS